MRMNEIRVGNLFQHNEEWNTFGHRGVFTWTEDEWYALGECTMLIDNVEPIPLTEEWLFKFGFNKCVPDIQNDHGLSHYYNTGDTFRVKRIYGGYILRELRGHLITIKEYDASHNHIIRFLHQLQNLYYALTGEELVYE